MPSELSDTLSDMKKIPSRQFQKQFGKVTETLKPGDVVQVTNRGEPVVQITKLGRQRIPKPNFAKRLAARPYPSEEGEALLRHLDEAVY
jgi:antitoxin (DNA-binding transcriptional repressor) of toxin-antitoxin stability system